MSDLQPSKRQLYTSDSSPEEFNRAKMPNMDRTPPAAKSNDQAALIKAMFETQNSKMEALFDRQLAESKAIEERLQEALNSKVGELEAKLETVTLECKELRLANKAMEERILHLERDAKHLNIVISGLEFTTPEQGFAAANELLQSKVDKNVKVTGIRSFTTRKGDKKIVAACGSLLDKRTIMAAKKSLQTNDGNRTAKIFVDDDLTPGDRQIQYKAREFAKMKREKGSDVRIGTRKVKVDGEWLFYDEDTDDFVRNRRFRNQGRSPHMERPGAESQK